jgi:hypothetical protein
MNDIFPYVCKHVIGCPSLNLDVSTFVFQPEVLQKSAMSQIFITDYLLPLMHAILRETRLPLITVRPMICLKFFVLSVAIQPPRIGDAIGGSSVRITDGHIESVIKSFAKCQRVYYALGRFVRICRFRCAQTKNGQDLHLADIREGDARTYTLVHGGAKYVFRVNELRDTIMSCITNTEDFFPAILDVRNPYNNLPLSLCDMYNFYFFLKTQNYGIPMLLHGFFMSDFSVPRYIMDYEILLRDKAIDDHVMHGSVKTLYPSVFRMLLQYRKCIRSIHIAKGFPIKTLVNVMRPYLRLFFYVMHYAQDFPKRYESEALLERRLNEFDYICPNFGERVRSTSILHVTCIPLNMDDGAIRKLFSDFGEVGPVVISPMLGDDMWGHGYVVFRCLDAADVAFSRLQGFCYNGIEAKDGMKIEKVSRIPRRENVRIDGLSPPRVCYSASHPAFHKIKDNTILTPLTHKVITLTDAEDTLFNSIEEHGTVDAWSENDTDADDIDDGMYVGQYYCMMADTRKKLPRFCRRRFSRRRSPSESVASVSDDDDNGDDNDDDNDDCSTGLSSDTDTTGSVPDIEHDVVMTVHRDDEWSDVMSQISMDEDVAAQAHLIAMIGPVEEEEEEVEEAEDICDMLTRDIASLSMSDVRVARHLHTVNVIHGRLSEMLCEHEVAIHQIEEEEYGVMSDASDSDDEM